MENELTAREEGVGGGGLLTCMKRADFLTSFDRRPIVAACSWYLAWRTCSGKASGHPLASSRS